MVRRVVGRRAAVVALSFTARVRVNVSSPKRICFKFTWIADPQISPDGVDGRVRARDGEREENRYETSLFAVPSQRIGGAAAADVRHPRHRRRAGRPTASADRVHVAAVEKDGKTQPAQIYVLAMDGGEAQAPSPTSAAAPATRRGRRTARRSRSAQRPAKRETRRHSQAKPDARAQERRQVVTRAVYRANGNPGYVDNDHHAHIFTIPAPGSDAVGPRSEQVSADADHRRRVRRARHRSGRPTDRRSTSPRRACRSRTTTRRAPSCMRCRPAAARSPRSPRSTAASAASRCRLTASGSRSSARLRGNADPFVQPVRSLGDRRDAGPARRSNLTADLRLRHRRRHRRRSVGAARAECASRFVWSTDRRVAARRLRRKRQLEPEARRRSRPAQVDPVTDRLARRRRLQRDARMRRRSPPTLSTQTAIIDDRGRCADGRKAAADHARQRRPLQRHPAERAGRNLVSELRRPEHPGLDPQTAGLRSVEEVSADSRDPRRAALRLRQRLHARVPVDGGEGLRRAVHQPARQHVVRAGLRQHHPVPLPRRRLQGPDGRRRRDRSRRATSTRTASASPAAAAADCSPTGRSRRRQRFKAGGRAARHRRLVRLLVHRRLHAVPADLVPQGAVGGSAGLRRALADHPRRERDDAADARATATRITGRRRPTAAR